MMTPYRGRGRGGCGRGAGGNNMLPRPEQTVPLLGDWTTFRNQPNRQQLPASAKKEVPSSSASIPSTTSYKDAAVKDTPPELEYFENPITEHVLYLESEDVKMSPNDGWSLSTRYFESRGYPGLHGQARPNLEVLLTVTRSVTITHHFQNNNPDSFINFSKCHVNKILLPREWGLNPNGDKAIKIAEGKYIYFNYWDYIQAFIKAFYYQNPKNKHSWFFSVNPEILEKPIPNWIYEWWSKFGPSLEILPKEINDLYASWCDNGPLLANHTEKLYFGQCPFFFFTKFQIPWIWRWSISIAEDKLNIPILRRNFFYKWWNKISEEDIQKMMSKIQSVINNDASNAAKHPTHQHIELAKLKGHLQKKYPHESGSQIMVRVLDFMMNQFLSTFPETVATRDDEIMETSSQGSMGPNSFDVLAGESQALEDPTIEDIWDALIEGISQQSRDPSKGKKKISME